MTEMDDLVALLLDRKQVLTESGKVRRSWAATDLDRQAAALIAAQAAQIAALEGERDGLRSCLEKIRIERIKARNNRALDSACARIDAATPDGEG